MSAGDKTSFKYRVFKIPILLIIDFIKIVKIPLLKPSTYKVMVHVNFGVFPNLLLGFGEVRPTVFN